MKTKNPIDKKRQQKESSIWNKLASGYDKKSLKTYKKAYEQSIERTRNVVSNSDRVLEIGCGTGIVTLGIAKAVQHVMATDISPKMIATAREKAEHKSVTNVEFHVNDGYALPYDDDSFDVVLLFNVLHFVKEPKKVLQEARRLLKPSGALVSATDCYAEPVPLPIRFKLGIQNLLHRIGIIPFAWFFNIESLEALYQDNDFLIKETAVLHDSPVNYYIHAVKKNT